MHRLITIAALLMLFPFTSQAKTLDELLIEKGVVAQDEVRAGHHGGAKVYWNKGTRLEFPDTGFSTRVFTEIRTRYEFTDHDSDTGIDNTSSFEVNNVRLGVAGHILNKEFTYYVKAALTADKIRGDGAGVADATSADILDAYITWEPCDTGALKMGQFKSAVARGYQTELVNMQFADRSVVTEHFNLGRQAGLAATVDVIEGLELGAQVLNGVEDATRGLNTDHAFVVHARVPLTGELDSTVEGDVGHTDELAADVGAAYGYNKLGDADLHAISVDANVKSGGFSFHGEFFHISLDPASGSSVEDTGFYAQAGYFVVPKEVEVAARYGLVDCEDASAGGSPVGFVCAAAEEVSEVNASVNYYWWQHHLKAQLGYSILSEDVGSGSDINTNRWLLQVSGWF